MRCAKMRRGHAYRSGGGPGFKSAGKSRAARAESVFSQRFIARHADMQFLTLRALGVRRPRQLRKQLREFADLSPSG